MEPPGKQAGRIFRKDPLRHGADNLVETSQEVRLQPTAVLLLPNLQDQRPERGACHHRPLQQLRHHHHLQERQAREALDQQGRGLSHATG